jgi:hypothetical protein
MCFAILLDVPGCDPVCVGRQLSAPPLGVMVAHPRTHTLVPLGAPLCRPPCSPMHSPSSLDLQLCTCSASACIAPTCWLPPAAIGLKSRTLSSCGGGQTLGANVPIWPPGSHSRPCPLHPRTRHARHAEVIPGDSKDRKGGLGESCPPPALRLVWCVCVCVCVATLARRHTWEEAEHTKCGAVVSASAALVLARKKHQASSSSPPCFGAVCFSATMAASWLWVRVCRCGAQLWASCA